MAAGEHLGRETLAALHIPFLDQVAVAVDQLGRTAAGENDITVPCLGRVILDSAHGNDGGARLSHAGAREDRAEAEGQRLDQLHTNLF